MHHMPSTATPQYPNARRAPGRLLNLAPALALAMALALTATGCAKRTIVAGESDYTRSARYAFEEAESALAGSYHKEAIQGFRKVMNRYPQSKYATLAELRIADTQYEEQTWEEAASSYRQFARRHPTHEKAAYAAYRVGLSYYSARPDNIFLFPPDHEYDQTPTKNAIAGFRTYLRRYPEDTLADDAKTKIAECRTMLAEHEIYVARFYRHRDKLEASAGRFEIVREQFGDLTIGAEAMFELADVYVTLKQAEKAEAALQSLIAAAPGDELVARARRRLDEVAKLPRISPETAPESPPETPPENPAGNAPKNTPQTDPETPAESSP